MMPGKKELSVLSIKPYSIDTSSFVGHSLTLPNAEKDEERVRYVTDVLAPEDISLCESVQRGLQSMGYSQGPIIADAQGSGTAEHGIHHFHRLVYQTLNS